MSGFKRVLGFILGLLVLAFIALHPTQLTVPMIGKLLDQRFGLSVGLDFIKRVNVTLADLVLAAAFGVWFLEMLARKQWRELKSVTAPTLVLVGCCALSALPFLKSDRLGVGLALDRFRAVKEILQVILYLVCGVWLMSEFLKRKVWARWALRILLIVITVVVLVGFYEFQWLRPPGTKLAPGFFISPMKVDATFGVQGIDPGAHEVIGSQSNRNVLGAWLTLMLPVLWGLYLCSRSRRIHYWCFALFWVGLALVLSAGLWVAALAGVAVVSAIHGRRALVVGAVALALFCGLMFWFAPQQPGGVLLDSLLVYKQTDEYKTLPLYDNKITYPDLYHSPKGAKLQGDPRFWPWQQKYIEWQPGLVMLRWSPVFGVGIGNYQKNIGLYYIYPGEYLNFIEPNNKPKANLMEPDAVAFYMVWASEVGLLGLFAWLWFVGDFAARGLRDYRFMDDGNGRGLVLGSVGALVALLLGSCFTHYLVRGVLPALILVLAVAKTGEFLAVDREVLGATQTPLADDAAMGPGEPAMSRTEKKD